MRSDFSGCFDGLGPGVRPSRWHRAPKRDGVDAELDATGYGLYERDDRGEAGKNPRLSFKASVDCFDAGFKFCPTDSLTVEQREKGVHFFDWVRREVGRETRLHKELNRSTVAQLVCRFNF